MRSSRMTAVAVAVLAMACPTLVADDRAAVDALNAPMKVIQDKNKCWKTVFDASMAMTAAPGKAEDLDVLKVWPGMEGWDAMQSWAAANAPMGQALIESQKALAFGMPYGRDAVGPTFVERGVVIQVGDGLQVYRSEPRYLKEMDKVTAYVAAEMYRLGGEKKFDEAFSLGIACLKVLRQVADQHLLEEKVWALNEMCDVCSLQRDVMQTFLADIPGAVLKKFSLTGYAFVRPTDGERLRRLDMPEGDRVLAEAMINLLFDERGQPDAAKFAATMGEMQARDEPLSAFGAARRWQQIAGLHGSKDQALARLTNIYDDWWRRWRLGYFDKLLDNPTVISRTNRTRYAMVLLMVKDLERVFQLRQRLNAELNGTVLAFGLCARYRDLGSWPRGLDETYTQYTVKRFDRDPWDPDWGRWQYANLAAPREIETDFGRVRIEGGVIYARGADRADNSAAKATSDGVTGDFVAWPALRALARMQGAK
ncbi:MAG: hypothetical protein ACKOGJ_02530 [Phycisphaerales bacterium]